MSLPAQARVDAPFFRRLVVRSSLAIAAILVLLGSGVMAVRASGYLDYRALVRVGAEAPGVLRAKGPDVPAGEAHRSEPKRRMAFEYRDPHGSLHRFVHHASDLFYDAHDVGCYSNDWYLACEPFLHTIRYLPETPRIAMPEEDMHFHTPLLALGALLFVLALVAAVLMLLAAFDRRRPGRPLD